MQHHGAPDGQMVMLRSSCTDFARSFARADGLPMQQRALQPTATEADGGCVPATAGYHGAFECESHAAQLPMLLMTAGFPRAHVGGWLELTCVAGAASSCDLLAHGELALAIDCSRADRHVDCELESRQVSSVSGSPRMRVGPTPV